MFILAFHCRRLEQIFSHFFSRQHRSLIKASHFQSTPVVALTLPDHIALLIGKGGFPIIGFYFQFRKDSRFPSGAHYYGL
ncbi:hypothetical protein TNIN_464191 [Trichonephila inaurata madagascariensis]|uniref:Uncharacterized protein n=1 Tax=Trichonephila inaurata madagascariensis TaxID=2747483 RepID=A0A8X6XQ74_9ARAC|nr:hypothetical protein TNIN_464191 [Trichonephila inaurata madagascariensis]